MTRLAYRGFSLFEFVVVIVVIAILSGLLLTRVLPLLAQAEHVAFLRTKQDVQSALLLEAAERIVRGESETLIDLTGINPIELLLEPPGNYVGSEFNYANEGAPRRSWYFDGEQGILIYRPGRYSGFVSGDAADDRIEMRVSFVYRDRDGDGSFNASVDHFDGLKFESAHPYSWAP